MHLLLLLFLEDQINLIVKLAFNASNPPLKAQFVPRYPNQCVANQGLQMTLCVFV